MNCYLHTTKRYIQHSSLLPGKPFRLLQRINTWELKQAWCPSCTLGVNSYGCVHCIVPGGGITTSGKWKYCKYKGKYLFPKRALSKVFRAKFMATLRKKIDVPQHIAKQVFKTKWVVYAKRPFASPETVVEYLGRYTHKIAISNHKLIGVNERTITFWYKD